MEDQTLADQTYLTDIIGLPFTLLHRSMSMLQCTLPEYRAASQLKHVASCEEEFLLRCQADTLNNSKSV